MFWNEEEGGGGVRGWLKCRFIVFGVDEEGGKMIC